MICVALANLKFSHVVKIVEQEDLVELRLDSLFLSDEELATVCQKRAAVIATFRPVAGIRDEERRRILGVALQAGAKYVDIEVEADSEHREALLAAARAASAKVIISYHNFQETPAPEVLKRTLLQGKHLGADIVKTATNVQSQQDAISLLQLLRESVPQVVVGMGPNGAIVRVASPLLGGLFTFAFPDGGVETAPGQICVSDLRALYAALKNVDGSAMK